MKLILADGTTSEVYYRIDIILKPGSINVKYGTLEYFYLKGLGKMISYTTKDIMDIPSARTNSYDTSKCHATVGTVKVKLKNIDLKVSEFIYNALNSDDASMYKARVRIFEIKDNVETQVFGGIVRSITLDDYETYYELEIADIQEELKTTVFAEFFSSVVAEKPILPTGFSEVNITDSEGAVTGIKLVFEGNPFAIVRGILQLLGIDGGDVFYVDSDFADTKYTGTNFYYEFTEALESPLEWIEKNIFQPLNYFPYIDNQGRLGIKKQQQPTVDSGIILDKSCLVEVPKKKIDFSKIVNNIYIDNEYDWTEQEYARRDLFVDETSIMKHGKVPKAPMEIEVQGLKNFTEIEKRSFVENCAKTVFERFSTHSIGFNVKVLMSKGASLNVGDFVMLTHDKVIEWEGGNRATRGIVATGGTRYAIIGEDTWADYSGKEDNDAVGYLTVNHNGNTVFSGQVVRVSRIIREELFTTIITSNNKVSSFLDSHGR